MTTWNPAKEIKHEEPGHLPVGVIADVAVFRLEKGSFGFVDMYGARLKGTRKLTAELMLRDEKLMWDLNGLDREDLEKLPENYTSPGDSRWDGRAGGSGRRRGTRP